MTLGEACGKTDWQVHAWCLMRNHFHLVVETPKANLIAGMRWFLGTYTARFNRRHKLFGHLFSGRYKSLVVDGSGSASIMLSAIADNLLAGVMWLRGTSGDIYLLELMSNPQKSSRFLVRLEGKGARQSARNREVFEGRRHEGNPSQMFCKSPGAELHSFPYALQDENVVCCCNCSAILYCSGSPSLRWH